MRTPTALRSAAIVREMSYGQAIYRLKAGRAGAGRQIAAIRDGGFGEAACRRELTREAARHGYSAVR